jgi:hypothetical protein
LGFWVTSGLVYDVKCRGVTYLFGGEVLWGDETVSMGINCVFFVLGALLGSFFFFLFIYLSLPSSTVILPLEVGNLL